MEDKGRAVGARLKPDLVWLRRYSGGVWMKVVVDMKVTSTEDSNNAFKEKDDKFVMWATLETGEKCGQGGDGAPHHLS